jgi:hypothetical protein
MKLNDYKQKALKDPKFKKEYNALKSHHEMFIIQLSNEQEFFSNTEENKTTSVSNQEKATTFFTQVVASKAIHDFDLRSKWPKAKVIKWEK